MPFTAASHTRSAAALAAAIALAACDGTSPDIQILHASAFATLQSESRAAHRPSPSLSPADVVRIQLDALRGNDELDGDAGIATVFQFASPANRSITGPLDRFIELVKTPEYRPMLNHRRAEPGPIITSGDLAEQRVLITTVAGDRVAYVFVLSRQRSGAYAGCWMTEGVLREATVEQNPPWGDIRKV